MPKRSPVTLEDVADWNNLVWAAYRAAQGRRLHPAVRHFMDNLEGNLRLLRQGLLDGSLSVGQATSFRIFDPKPRTIHAPVFPERVMHHALMRHLGPVLERSLVADTFACRKGKGAIAAVKRAQDHARRYAWFGKLDIRQYFPSISHAKLLGMLQRKFKDRGRWNFSNASSVEIMPREDAVCPSAHSRPRTSPTFTLVHSIASCWRRRLLVASSAIWMMSSGGATASRKLIRLPPPRRRFWISGSRWRFVRRSRSIAATEAFHCVAIACFRGPSTCRGVGESSTSWVAEDGKQNSRLVSSADHNCRRLMPPRWASPCTRMQLHGGRTN